MYLNQSYGFRSVFIRLTNQIEWSLFKNSPNYQVLIGKDGFLFYKDYTDAYNGNDFIGADKINVKIKELEYLNDTLGKLNKKLVLIFAPNKSDIYNQLLPRSFQEIKGTTNYNGYLNRLQESKIAYIDFNNCFKAWENNSLFPLFSPYGSHYSVYGACKTGDSIIRYIENITGKKLPDAIVARTDKSPPKGYDVDLMDLMNLAFPPHYKATFAYPTISVKEGVTSYKPNVLIIGDSFFSELIQYYHILDFFSKRSSFCLWNHPGSNILYDENTGIYTIISNQTKNTDLRNEIMKYDIIIIMSSLSNLPNLGWGFIENTYEQMHNNY
ncbi:MAG: alginate O-acetyltransferase AlgX-related protein [Bacteroidia bacterium]